MRVQSLLLTSLISAASAQLDALAKKAGKKYLGTAVDTRLLANDTLMDILTTPGEFGQITPENGQKWIFTEPEQGVFNWTEGHFVTDLTADLGYYLRCHALAWHSQLAPWVEARNWTKDEMREMLWNHVYTEAKHWRGQCYAWDVVNEALNEDGSYRESVFYNTLGEEYIKLAFRAATAGDPHAKLYYNDYNLEWPSAKSEGVGRIVRMLQDDGIRIDGVGMQAHLIAGSSPSIDDEIAVMESYAELGVEVALTEVDIRIDLPLTDENLEAQKQDYKNIVGACTQVDACVGITVWGFYDPVG